MHEANSTIGVICTVCKQPALVCHSSCHALMSSSFFGLPSRQCRRCALAVALHRRNSGLGISHAQKLRTFGLHEIFKCAHLIYGIWPQTHRHTYIHTTSANAVTLVWGSLRLAPTIYRYIAVLSRHQYSTACFSCITVSHRTSVKGWGSIV